MAVGSIAIVGGGNSLFGVGLKTVLQDAKQFAKIVQAQSYVEILEQLERHRSSRLLTVDLAMPEIRQPNHIRQIRMRYPKLCLVVIADSLCRADMLMALSAGAHGYVPTVMPFDEILYAFKRILSGEIFVPKEIADLELEKISTVAARNGAMTAREREIMELVASGNSNKMIARFLNLSEGTVKAHIHTTYRKLGVKNRASATAALAHI
ncbi:MAG: LuxR C-terminal-related transcriptional regulator [Shewanella sp.]